MSHAKIKSKGSDNTANYLIAHYKGTYRLKCEPDQITNQFPRKLNGTFEDVDVFIDCKFGNRIYSYGHGILQAYIPSVIRGHNIINYIEENIGEDVIFDIEELTGEILFKFKSKYGDSIIPLLKPKTAGASISPFSSKNQNKSYYKIPDEDLAIYKNIVVNIPKERILNISHTTKNFLKSLSKKKNSYEELKADMTAKGLKSREYIHSIGKWEQYLKYLKENLEC